MSYEEAKKRALKIDKGIDSAMDYGDAWLFYQKNDKSDRNKGIIVMKKSGELKMFTEYLLMRKSSGSPSPIQF